MNVKKKVGKPPLYDEKSKKMIVMIPYSITKAQVDTLRNEYLYPVIRKYLDEIKEDISEIQGKMTEPDEIIPVEIGEEDILLKEKEGKNQESLEKSWSFEEEQKEYEEMQRNGDMKHKNDQE